MSFQLAAAAATTPLRRAAMKQLLMTQFLSTTHLPARKRKRLCRRRRRRAVHIYYWETYRADFGYSFSDAAAENDWEDDTYMGKGYVTLPHKRRGFTVCILYNTSTFLRFGSKFVVECSTLDECEDLFLQLHSHVNGFGPFVMTGYTGNYKEKGSYSDPIAVKSRAVRAVKSHLVCSKPAVTVAVDAQGTVVKHMSLDPPA